MKTLNNDKFEYWRNHLEQSIKYPNGVQAYCNANRLATSAYYKWRQRILNLKPLKIVSKKVKSPFLPVVVSAGEPKMQGYPHQQRSHQLPNSRWVAEVIANVIRGLV